MEILKNKCLNKKLILALLVVMFLCIIFPNVSHAEATEAVQGGKLLQPVVDLLVTIGDGIMDVLQKAIVGTSGHVSLDIGKKGFWIKLVGIIAAILVFVAAAVITGGISAVVSAIGGVVGSALTAIGTTSLVTMMVSLGTLVGASVAYKTVVDVLSGAFLPDITILPTYSVSPQEIFEGKLLLFDVDFFHPKEVWVKYTDENGGEGRAKLSEYDDTDPNNVGNKIDYYYYIDTDGSTEVHTSKQNTALDLSSIISKWYYSIRNIALVIMMLVLLYIGIRIMSSSIASEKSKYKKMLGDWVVSMCLIFVLHYIMVFAVSINENIIKVVSSTTEEKQQAFVINLNEDMKNKDEFVDAVKGIGGDGNEGEYGKFLSDKSGTPLYDEKGDKNGSAGDAAMFTWMTNLVGRMRMLCQLQDGSSEYVGYAMAYIVLVFYTLFFTFTYLKRVLYMAFLTIIAPLVAMTYSIDKIADGKAQAFNMWLKEYIFNLLIQPMHLMLYLVLISMAYDLAATNIIYTLVAIGFMIPAEKFIRKMFGFEKAQTPGMLGGATGTALAMSGMQKLAHMAGRGPGPKGGKPVGKLDKSQTDDAKKIRTADAGRGMDALAGEINGNDNNSSVDAQSPLVLTDSNPDYVDGGMTELPESQYNNLDLKDPEDPMAKMEREALEDEIARNGTISGENVGEQISMLDANRFVDPQELSSEDEIGKTDTPKRSHPKIETFKRMSAKGLRNAVSKENIGNAVSRSIKTGTKVVGTATGALAGATLGIASGDINKVGQNMAIGATAGSSIGTAIGNGVTTGTSGIGDRYKNNKTEYEKELYGDKYAQHKKEEQDKEFLKDKEARKYFAQQCSTELSGLSGKERKVKLDSIMKEAVEYRKEGVTDNSIIVKARKLDKSGNTTATESKLAAVMATKAKDMEGMERYQKRIAKKLGDTKANEIAENASKLAGFYK